jgi:hypothetical protein
MTLLKKDDLLSLDTDTDVLVAGPNADDPIHQLDSIADGVGGSGGLTCRTVVPAGETDPRCCVTATRRVLRSQSVNNGGVRKPR